MKAPQYTVFMTAVLLMFLYTACQKDIFWNYYVSTYAGGNTFGLISGNVDSVVFTGPNSLAADEKGNIYLTEGGNHRIKKITPDGLVMIVAGKGSGFDDGIGTSARFNTPRGIAVDGAGNIYVADRGNQRIRKIAPNGKVSTLAGNGSIGSADGKGDAVQFYNPVGIAIDANGNIYVADSENHRIRKITPDGRVSTLAGSTRGFADGTGEWARFNNPVDVTIDDAGNIYVVDRNNQRIRKVSPEGKVNTLAGNGVAGFADGSSEDAQFSGPRGATADKEGNIYIADSDNNRIRKIAPDGKVSTLAGNSTPGFADGEQENAQFNDPRGITIDAKGETLFVADFKNLRVRKIILH